MDHSRAATENKVVASFLVADYNIKFEPESCFSMKRALWPTTRQISVQAKRLVTFVLLAGIAYSVTFGSAHRHTDPTQQLLRILQRTLLLALLSDRLQVTRAASMIKTASFAGFINNYLIA